MVFFCNLLPLSSKFQLKPAGSKGEDEPFGTSGFFSPSLSSRLVNVGFTVSCQLETCLSLVGLSQSSDRTVPKLSAQRNRVINKNFASMKESQMF